MYLGKTVKSRVGDLLISGGEDCCIHVWELETGEKLNTWAQHCGVILELLLVPSSSSNHQTKGRFLSISSDFSIGLYSYEALRTNALNMYSFPFHFHFPSLFTAFSDFSFSLPSSFLPPFYFSPPSLIHNYFLLWLSLSLSFIPASPYFPTPSSSIFLLYPP